jgi:hypothetical protein
MNSTEKGVTFLRRILMGGSHFYVEKLPRGQYSTGVTSLRYTDPRAPVLRMRPNKARSHVAVGVVRMRTLTAKSNEC